VSTYTRKKIIFFRLEHKANKNLIAGERGAERKRETQRQKDCNQRPQDTQRSRWSPGQQGYLLLLPAQLMELPAESGATRGNPVPWGFRGP
jgi:hypothetical protein